MSELEKLIAEAADEYASEALAEADAKIERLRRDMQKALDKEHKQAAARKEHIDAINNSAELLARAISGLANAMAKKVVPQAPNYRFTVIRDDNGSITEMVAIKE
jgi:sRNA-binding protein